MKFSASHPGRSERETEHSRLPKPKRLVLSRSAKAPQVPTDLRLPPSHPPARPRPARRPSCPTASRAPASPVYFLASAALRGPGPPSHPGSSTTTPVPPSPPSPFPPHPSHTQCRFPSPLHLLCHDLPLPLAFPGPSPLVRPSILSTLPRAKPPPPTPLPTPLRHSSVSVDCRLPSWGTLQTALMGTLQTALMGTLQTALMGTLQTALTGDFFHFESCNLVVLT